VLPRKYHLTGTPPAIGPALGLRSEKSLVALHWALGTQRCDAHFASLMAVTGHGNFHTVCNWLALAHIRSILVSSTRFAGSVPMERTVDINVTNPVVSPDDFDGHGNLGIIEAWKPAEVGMCLTLANGSPRLEVI